MALVQTFMKSFFFKLKDFHNHVKQQNITSVTAKFFFMNKDTFILVYF